MNSIKTILRSLLLIFITLVSCEQAGKTTPEPPLSIWFDAPTDKWNEGIPVGNGSLGAMFYGSPAKEIICMNEETIWSGQKHYDRDMPGAHLYMDSIRQLLFDGKYVQAEELVQTKVLNERLPSGTHSYQMLGNLLISRPGLTSVQNYKRALDLRKSVATAQFQHEGVTYTQESFSSYPDKVMVIKYGADQPGKVNFNASINRTENTKIEVVENSIQFSEHVSNGNGVKFKAIIDFELKGGKSTIEDGVLVIEGADEVVLRIVAASDYRGDDPGVLTDLYLSQARENTYTNLLKRHIEDYQTLFSRVSLDLSDSVGVNLPTNRRLDSVKVGKVDNYLTHLQYQYGRYLLISSSRPGTLPANLQGIWANGFKPPWNSDYHLNINIQMNYWMAEMTNLAELHEPFLEFIGNLREMGRITAREIYGARGFVAHHTSDVWHATAPFGKARYGMWPMGAAWSCQHLFTHYEYTEDEEYLRNHAYPIMKEAALFMIDFMVPHPETGLLVSGPSVSPENNFNTADGKKATINMGPTMDREIIFELFSNCIKAADILGIDQSFSDALQMKMDQMPPLEIGSDGRLMEWVEEFEEPMPGHRHISHLYGLHPSNQISKVKTPELFQSAQKTIDYRLAHGGGHTGWSRAWIINFFARLQDAEKAHENILALQRKSTLPNLLDLHPPFQIDGNFGVVSGITEMLMQSQDGEILVLPALPQAWPSGSIKGIVARGGFEVDITWTEGKLEQLKIKSLLGNPAKLRYGSLYQEYEIPQGESLIFNNLQGKI
ncbi:MAG: glycoside hydrolase family 95 protein [Cyclobacteriaceae bacterium]